MSVKKAFDVSEELKQRIESTIEASGMQQKEWIEAVTNLWIMQDMKQGLPDYQKDISELELHTNRINQLVMNMIQRSAFEKGEIERQVEEIKTAKNQIIEGYQVELSDLKKHLQAFEEEALRHKQMKEDAERHVRQLEEAGDNNKLLIQEYKEKNDTLTGLVNQFRQGYEDSQTLKIQISEMSQQMKKIESELQEEQQTIKDMEEIRKEQLHQQEERHKTEMERIVERKDVEKERELLQVRTEFQDKLQKANEESTAKIQGLYERIEQVRREYEQQIEQLKKQK